MNGTMNATTSRSGRVVYVRPALRNKPIVVMNGYNYTSRGKYGTHLEPCPSAWHALCAGLVIAVVVVGGTLALAVLV